MRKSLLIMTATLFLSGTALGDEAPSQQLGMRETKGYGPAGCGLGSLIFKPDSGFTQIFAATTNGTSGTQTFGITTGTSNCEDTRGGQTSARAFVETNRVALAKDIARGQGETIASLTELAGCHDAARVGQTLQRSFKQIFPSSRVSDAQVGDRVLEVLQSNSTLACGSLI
jgi:hypothetical protein